MLGRWVVWVVSFFVGRRDITRYVIYFIVEALHVNELIFIKVRARKILKKVPFSMDDI